MSKLEQVWRPAWLVLQIAAAATHRLALQAMMPKLGHRDAHSELRRGRRRNALTERLSVFPRV